MDLYRVVKAPFLIADGVVATIGYDKSFLAISSSGTMGKEMTENEVKDCQVYDDIYHCSANDDNVIRKDLQNLCLFALFRQSPDDIERLCRLEISEMTSHAIQLDGETFRILVTKPTQLHISCIEGENKIVTIEGVYLLKLTKNCNKAHTNDHVLNRNPTILKTGSPLALPTLNDTERWVKAFKREFESSDLKLELKEIRKLRPGPVPIATIKNRTKSRVFRKFRYYFAFVQYALTLIFILMFLRSFIGWMKGKQFCNFAIPCRIKRKKTRSPVSRNDMRLRETLTSPKQDWENTRRSIIRNYTTNARAVEIV